MRIEHVKVEEKRPIAMLIDPIRRPVDELAGRLAVERRRGIQERGDFVELLEPLVKVRVLAGERH